MEKKRRLLKEYGSVIADSFTFEKNGYTETVDSGDGDCLTSDTIWDVKVTKSTPNSKNTLQILMYYIMGKHLKHFPNNPLSWSIVQ